MRKLNINKVIGYFLAPGVGLTGGSMYLRSYGNRVSEEKLQVKYADDLKRYERFFRDKGFD